MADWGPVVIAVVLFVLLSPGLLFQLPGNSRVVEFANFQTSGVSICVHTVIFFGLITIFLIAIGVHISTEVNPLYARRFAEKIYRNSGAARYLEELQQTDLRPKIQWAISNARLKEKVAARARAFDISERKARIWSLQKQRYQARARLNAGELTQEEFNFRDATLEARVQAEKEAIQVLQQEASTAAAASDVQLRKRVEEEVLAKHEKAISNTEAYLLSFSLR
ncbi:uncharacterized protein A4U43_C09F13810 [Asparagus officinalis]|uniref:Uncharacterized protein n=1 Tax=Asparagus officinalis TaxID=4686 RepID=A0A5P1E7S5_ASPOF|nr:uncharacterized protein A4U43_C09F13810 [Asparagus officinalis]